MTRLFYIPDDFYWRFDSCNDVGWTIEFEESTAYFNYCLNKDTHVTQLSVRQVLENYVKDQITHHYYTRTGVNKVRLFIKEEFEIID